ncbi:hypothetical protein PFFCH_01913 [Plasmodium falciparum FCH/4]|uniref:Uncharacterized protein n=1 Tax=Plasmodium falciparum FCH/4 TaxID=1036724 RepID=A0A024VRT4_PLAFA|nr:hypothetical protein PFFCH_01913 [Plasmodium falciparum FCH/4]
MNSFPHMYKNKNNITIVENAEEIEKKKKIQINDMEKHILHNNKLNKNNKDEKDEKKFEFIHFLNYTSNQDNISKSKNIFIHMDNKLLREIIKYIYELYTSNKNNDHVNNIKECIIYLISSILMYAQQNVKNMYIFIDYMFIYNHHKNKNKTNNTTQGQNNNLDMETFYSNIFIFFIFPYLKEYINNLGTHIYKLHLIKNEQDILLFFKNKFNYINYEENYYSLYDDNKIIDTYDTKDDDNNNNYNNNIKNSSNVTPYDSQKKKKQKFKELKEFKECKSIKHKFINFHFIKLFDILNIHTYIIDDKHMLNNILSIDLSKDINIEIVNYFYLLQYMNKNNFSVYIPLSPTFDFLKYFKEINKCKQNHYDNGRDTHKLNMIEHMNQEKKEEGGQMIGTTYLSSNCRHKSFFSSPCESIRDNKKGNRRIRDNNIDNNNNIDDNMIDMDTSNHFTKNNNHINSNNKDDHINNMKNYIDVQFCDFSAISENVLFIK